jgi:hypothetical protein
MHCGHGISLHDEHGCIYRFAGTRFDRLRARASALAYTPGAVGGVVHAIPGKPSPTIGRAFLDGHLTLLGFHAMNATARAYAFYAGAMGCGRARLRRSLCTSSCGIVARTCHRFNSPARSGCRTRHSASGFFHGCVHELRIEPTPNRRTCGQRLLHRHRTWRVLSRRDKRHASRCIGRIGLQLIPQREGAHELPTERRQPLRDLLVRNRRRRVHRRRRRLVHERHRWADRRQHRVERRHRTGRRRRR